MIFVIGDIHGMLDALKNLIWHIEDKYRYTYRNENEIEELIFLGDYIDYGPNTKEVIDYITALPYKKTFLAGNHEDLLLQFFHEELRDKHFSESHWLRDNEGYRTIRSLTGLNEWGITPARAAEVIEQKYMDFFESLLYIYEKEINGQKYLFSHGHVDEHNLDVFLQLDRYDKFHNYLLENDILIYNTPIWERKDCRYNSLKEEFTKIRNYIVIHGHTPVTAMSKTPTYVEKYQAPYIEVKRAIDANETKIAKYIGEESILEFDLKIEDIYGINIDTGIAIGYGLSTLGIEASNISKERQADTKDKIEYTVIQSRSDTINKLDYYMRYYKYILKK